ncbi:MAG: DNA methyltransferase [Acidimicrobiales bacterium]|jgi:site-specific DNA-methyltransferase (adenine-specific)
MTGPARYQVLPPLQEAAYRSLRADIERHGVLVPIDVDEEGEILDGHNRQAIADELGIDCPRVVRAGLGTDAAKVDYALRMNLLRRHLGPVEWAGAFRRLAEVRGVSLGGKGGRPSTNRDTVSQLAAELGVSTRTAQRRLRLEDRLGAHPDIVRLLDTGEIDAHRAEVLARTRVFEDRRAAARPPRRSRLGDIDVRLGRFQEVLGDLADDSVDLVLTDPPWAWDGDTLSLWDDLGMFANRVLRPAGVLLAYSGSGCLAEAVLRLRLHLVFVFSGSLPLSGPHCEVFPVMARDASTPILFFSKGRYVPRRWFTNAVASPGPEKEAHPWQRPLSNVTYYLERLSEPGELVCDPLLGGGTTAVAAQQLGRRFIGCDVDPGAVEVTLERLHGIEGSRAIKGHLEPRDEEPCG